MGVKSRLLPTPSSSASQAADTSLAVHQGTWEPRLDRLPTARIGDQVLPADTLHATSV
jgi:hypothetical protein